MMIKNKTVTRKKLIAGILIMGILITSLLIGCFLGLRKGTYAGEDSAFYYRINESTYQSLSGEQIRLDENGCMTFEFQNGQKDYLTIASSGKVYTITFSDGSSRDFTRYSETKSLCPAYGEESIWNIYLEGLGTYICTGDHLPIDQFSLVEAAIYIKSGHPASRNGEYGIIAMLIGLVSYIWSVRYFCSAGKKSSLRAWLQSICRDYSTSSLLMKSVSIGFLILAVGIFLFEILQKRFLFAIRDLIFYLFIYGFFRTRIGAAFIGFFGALIGILFMTNLIYFIL